ncbi:MAG: hypothetical protein LC676_10895 [Loktanella sp.]|nr:hypothetical protein [Loktanella sp.]
MTGGAKDQEEGYLDEQKPAAEIHGPAPHPDSFEVSLRFFGNEIVGFAMNSSSTAKNWAFFGLLAMLSIAAFASATAPAILRFTDPVAYERYQIERGE